MTTLVDHGLVGWLLSNVPELRPPLQLVDFEGGRSNVTSRVTDADGRVLVVRRPPPTRGLPTAHDVRREYRVQLALQDSPVPVPRVLALCEDLDVPFYVMEHVEGNVLRDPSQALTPAFRDALTCSIADALAAIHAVDLRATGLEDLGPTSGYVARQLARWDKQLHASSALATEQALLAEAHARLVARIPPQHETTLVHGDFRLDNAIVTLSGEVAAVLDWETCTLGDPLADLALLLAYTTTLGHDAVLDPSVLRDRYAHTSGRDVGRLDYHLAFSYWKLGCIAVTVFARRSSHADPQETSQVRAAAAQLAHLADAATTQLGAT